MKIYRDSCIATSAVRVPHQFHRTQSGHEMYIHHYEHTKSFRYNLHTYIVALYNPVSLFF